MKIRNVIFWLGVFTWFASPSSARIMAHLPYEDLWKKSDLVVIAEPLTKTTDTDEKTYFSGIRSLNDDGQHSDVPAIGVETQFKILVVLKGDNHIENFVLHLYRRPVELHAETQLPVYSINGPMTVYFDPDIAAPAALLFLIKE